MLRILFGAGLALAGGSGFAHLSSNRAGESVAAVPEMLVEFFFTARLCSCRFGRGEDLLDAVDDAADVLAEDAKRDGEVFVREAAAGALLAIAEIGATWFLLSWQSNAVISPGLSAGSRYQTKQISTNRERDASEATIPNMRETYLRNDADVIADALKRPGEFTELYKRHSAPVFRYIASRLGRESAEDLSSETFLVAFERRDAFNPDALSALPWLLGIATQLIRRNRREEAASWRLSAAFSGLGGEGTIHSVHDPSNDADARIEANAAVRSISNAMAKMPKRDREVLALAAWSELDSGGIAEALGIPEGTVRSRLHRCRRILRAHLEAGGVRDLETHDERSRIR